MMRQRYYKREKVRLGGGDGVMVPGDYPSAAALGAWIQTVSRDEGQLAARLPRGHYSLRHKGER